MDLSYVCSLLPLPLCDVSCARLSACSREFDSKDGEEARKNVNCRYAFLSSPSKRSIEDHMVWWCSQNLHAVSHLKKIWRVLCDCFETYSPSQRDEIIHYMCFGKLENKSLIFILQEPRTPSPGDDYVWKNGKWVLNLTYEVPAYVRMVHNFSDSFYRVVRI